MEENASSSAAVNPSPAPAPVPAPAPAPAAPSPEPAASAPSSGGSFIDMVKKDAVPILIGGIGITALFWVIWYYRFNLNTAKGYQTSFQNQLDEMKIELSDLKSIDNKQSTGVLLEQFT
jgi:hypothetical protein